MQTILVGMGGWDLPAFTGRFYPSKIPKGFRKLEYYSRFFDMVEVNATFYTTSLRPQQAYRWLEDVAQNGRFTFTVKLYRGFTHTFDATQQDIHNVKNVLNPLAAEDKLGGVVIQFPHSFTNVEGNRERLRQIAKQFQEYVLFVELRHNSWNSEEADLSLKEQKLHCINVDLPQIKRHMPFTSKAWGDAAYFRMMGRNAEHWDSGSVQERYKYHYSEHDIDELLNTISSLRSNVRKAMVVFHNDPDANSAVNGFQLKHRIRGTEKVQAPAHLMRAFPELSTIAISAAEEGMLF